MRKQPRQSRAIQTKRACVTAAEMLLPTRGPLALTPTEVARRAGVSPGSFYQYFPSKQALLAELAELWMQGHLADLSACLPLLSAADGATQFVTSMRERFAARPNMHHVLMGSLASIEDNQGINAIREKTLATFVEAVSKVRGTAVSTGEATVLLHQIDSTLTALCLGLIPIAAEQNAISMLIKSVTGAVRGETN